MAASSQNQNQPQPSITLSSDASQPQAAADTAASPDHSPPTPVAPAEQSPQNLTIPPRAPNDTRTGLLSSTRRSSSLENLVRIAGDTDSPSAYNGTHSAGPSSSPPHLSAIPPEARRWIDESAPSARRPSFSGALSQEEREIARAPEAGSRDNGQRKSRDDGKKGSESSHEESCGSKGTSGSTDDGEGTQRKRGSRRSVFQRLSAFGSSEKVSERPTSPGKRGSGMFSGLRPGLARSEPVLPSSNRRESTEEGEASAGFEAGPSDTTLHASSKESLSGSPTHRKKQSSDLNNMDDFRRGSWSSTEDRTPRRGRSRDPHSKSISIDLRDGEDRGKRPMRSRNTSGKHSPESNRKMSSGRRGGGDGSDGDDWPSLNRTGQKRPGSAGQYITASAFMGVQDARDLNVIVDVGQHHGHGRRRAETGAGFGITGGPRKSSAHSHRDESYAGSEASDDGMGGGHGVGRDGNDDSDESAHSGPRRSSGQNRSRQIIFTRDPGVFRQDIDPTWNANRRGTVHTLQSTTSSLGRKEDELDAQSGMQIDTPLCGPSWVPPRWLSLRNAMAFTNVVIITIAIIIIAIVSYHVGQANANGSLVVIGMVAMREVALTMALALGRAESTASTIASMMTTLGATAGTPQCAGAFWGYGKGGPRWRGDQMYMVGPNGAFCGVSVDRFPGYDTVNFTFVNDPLPAYGMGLRLANGTSPATRWWWPLNGTTISGCPNYADPNCVTSLLSSEPTGWDIYDPTQMPFFQSAFRSTALNWTSVYDLGSGDGYGMTVSLPVIPPGGIIPTGVAAVDLRLSSMSTYLRFSTDAQLREMNPEDPAGVTSGVNEIYSFIVVEEDSRIVVASTCERLTLRPTSNSTTGPLRQNAPPVLFDSLGQSSCWSGNMLEDVGPFDRLSNQVVYSSGNTSTLSTFSEVWRPGALIMAGKFSPRPGLRWIIIGRFPSKFFTDRLGKAYALQVPLTAGLVLLAAGLASFLITRAIGRPLKRAAEKMMRIANLNFDEEHHGNAGYSGDEEEGGDDDPCGGGGENGEGVLTASVRWWRRFSTSSGGSDHSSGSGDLELGVVASTDDLRRRHRSRSQSRGKIWPRKRRWSSASTMTVKHSAFALKEIQILNTAMSAMTSGLKSFSKYVPLEVVALLVKMQKEAVLGVNEMSLSVFFSDIANFTTITERMAPQTLVHVMSEYLNEMSNIILDSQGIVDKFIGDAVMAFWNAPLFLDRHAMVACGAALRSQERLRELRDVWQAQGFPEIRARIGINTGPALVGNLGSPSRLNYTCLGDTVNLASRLEGLNKRYSTSIIISHAVRIELEDHFVLRPLDYVAVKGKTVAVKCYELIDFVDGCDPTVLARANLYTQAFDLYCQSQFEEARIGFERYLLDVPWDVPANMHLEECMRLAEEQVPQDWSPVVVLEEK
ncbi:hypothetical protein HK097_002995 [Rhizophlyctis rosea]|uniref:Guanylate cyclase domain-containing protein n=1 Tax=Rhizophlyctis rosea TaxID=64517 RepID=A0AAD5SA70_9FUNG|nr:hypothetical protein HK097_002995 [Rhizophlyctis rosea]